MEYLDTLDNVDDILDTLYPDSIRITYFADLSNVTPATPNFELLCPLFGWTPADIVKRTFEVTTQYARGHVLGTLKQYWPSRFPECNVKRRNDPVAADTVFSDTPEVNSDKTFMNTLEYNICEGDQWINLSAIAQKRK
jgi:hypothetical protein